MIMSMIALASGVITIAIYMVDKNSNGKANNK